MSLTDTKVKNARPAEKAVKLTDGFGLYLLLHPNGSKYWQLGYRFDGKQKVFSIGVYPAVSLADARQRRDEAKKLLAQSRILLSSVKPLLRCRPSGPRAIAGLLSLPNRRWKKPDIFYP